MDYTVHGILQTRIDGVGSLSFLQGIFPTQGLNPGRSHCRQILYQLSHKGSPRILEWVAYPFSSRSSQPRNQTGVSGIGGGFFTNWSIREFYIKDTFIYRKKRFPGCSVVKNQPANAGDVGLIPGLERSPGVENGNAPQYSCLENPMDRGVLWATVRGGRKRAGHDLVTKQR